MEIKFAAWAETIMSRLTPEQTQQMLNTEFGGMNEVLADLYADTGDKRWLNLSRRFDHNAFLDLLKRREDKLAGQHGNTQAPKMLGVLMQYIYTGDKSDGVAAEFFREFGWQSFGGNVRVNGNWVNVQPRDAFRRRVYIASLGLWLTLDAGTFEQVAFNTQANVVRVSLSPATVFTPNARLRVEQPARISSIETYSPRRKFVNERGAYTIPLLRSTLAIELEHR